MEEVTDQRLPGNAKSPISSGKKTIRVYAGAKHPGIGSAMSQYKNPLWTNRVGYVDWSKLTGEVRNDIEICRNGFPDSVALENNYVRVMRNSAGCAPANTPGYGTRIIVALTGIKIGSSRGPGALERGGVTNPVV